MDIGFYIADLLRNQDEVSLPGLGTFTKERVAGSYDISSNSFMPPSYQISFNRELDDFTSLSQYISFKKNLSQSSAEYFVKKFTTTILDLLQTSGIAEVKPLGIIRQNDYNITFEASSSYQIAGKFYGLKPIAELRDILPASVNYAGTDIANAVMLVEAPGPIQDSSILDLTTAQAIEVEEQEYIEESESSRSLPLISGAIVLALVATILLYFFNPAIRDKLDSAFTQSDTTVPASPASDNSPKVVVPALPDSANSQTTIAKIAADSSSISSVNEPAEIEIITYEIVGATFGKSSEAESYIKTMKKRGFKAKVLEDMPGTLFKVSLASFPDYKSAQKELNRIVKEVEKTAWTTKYKSTKSNK